MFVSNVWENLLFSGQNQLFCQNQFGLRRKIGCIDAAVSLTENVRQNYLSNYQSVGVILDLKKAFDTVNHSILYEKFENYGIRGLALDWIKSYLTKRTHSVKYQNSISSKKTLSCGIPQGSVLGPLLFLVYINDFHAQKFGCCPKNWAYIFADDTWWWWGWKRGATGCDTAHPFLAILLSVKKSRKITQLKWEFW